MRWPWQKMQLEEPKPRPSKPKMHEIGSTGTHYFSGIISDEYNTDLQGNVGLTVYDKMRRSDAQVQALLWVCELPIRSAKWYVEPASNSAEDVAIAEIVERELLQEMTVTWDDFLRQALLMLPFGHMVFEKVWERRNGGIFYRKFAPRLPTSINKWDIERDGGLRGIEQLVWTGKSYERPYIPIEKLLVFTFRKEGANWLGMSVLRSAYKHWFYKDNFYRIDAISAERHGVGIPYVKMAQQADTEDYDEAAEILQALHAHERSYVVGKPTWEEFTMVGVARATESVRSVMDSIRHHDVMIARSVLAQFLNLGSEDVGSYALSQDQSSLFLLSLQSVAEQIATVVNKYAIQPMVDLNWTVQGYPQLNYTKIEHRDLAAYGKAVADLINAGAIVVDDGLRAVLREMFSFPEEPEDITTLPAPPMGQSTDGDSDNSNAADDGNDGNAQLTDCSCGNHRLNDAPFWRELRATEDRVLLEDLDMSIEWGREEYFQVAKRIAARQMDRLVELVIPAIEARNPDKVNSLSVPYKAEMADELTQVLRWLYERGYDSVAQERSRKVQGSRGLDIVSLADPIEAAAYLAAKAKAAAQLFAVRLQAALTWEALDQIKQGTIDPQALENVMDTLSDRELKKSAAITVSEALSFGRRDGIEAIRDEIDRAQYSAILDRRVCSVCEGLDGLEVTLDDPRYEQYNPPNPECLGGDRCRCVWVLIFKGEKRSTVR